MSKGNNASLIVRSEGKTMIDFDEDKATITLGGAKTDCTFFSNMAFSKDRLAMELEFDTTDPVKLDADGNIKVDLTAGLALPKPDLTRHFFHIALY